jgi:hypothetical protein
MGVLGTACMAARASYLHDCCHQYWLTTVSRALMKPSRPMAPVARAYAQAASVQLDTRQHADDNGQWLPQASAAGRQCLIRLRVVRSER